MKEILEKVKNGSYLCQCNEISYRKIYEELKNEPPRFEAFIKENNLGNRCTSCLPDCETYYHYLQKNFDKTNHYNFEKKSIKFKYKINLKEKVYNLIDLILPEKLIEYKVFIPVVISEKIDTYIVNGNFSYPFEKSVTEKKKIYGNVYDSEGNLHWKFNTIIEPNKLLRLKIPKPDNSFVFGYAEIFSKFQKKGLQGTKRVHLNLVSKESISQLHSSSPQTIKELFVEYICNAKIDEKVFLLISNLNKELNKIKIFNEDNILINEFEVGSRKTRMIELPKDLDEARNKTIVRCIRIQSLHVTGLINILYSVNNYDIISIDHIDPHQFAQRATKLNKKISNN